MITPAKKKSVVADEIVDLVGASHAQDEPMPTRFAPSSRISYWLTLQHWGHRGLEGGWEGESLLDKQACFSPVSTSTVDFRKEFQWEICPVIGGGLSMLGCHWCSCFMPGRKKVKRPSGRLSARGLKPTRCKFHFCEGWNMAVLIWWDFHFHHVCYQKTAPRWECWQIFHTFTPSS